MASPWEYSHSVERPAPPSPANVQARTYLLDVMQRGLPGYPTDDRYLQSQKFTGLVYTAIRPLMRQVRKADVVCLKRVRKRRGRTTFGPNGVVAKSMSAGYGKSQRDDYVPVDADHPVARVLDRPQQRDGTETLGDVLEYATLQAALTGVSPFWCVPSKAYLSRGDWRPVQLYALPTALTWPQAGASPEYPCGYYRLMPYYATPTGGAGYFNGRAAGAAGAVLDGREVKRRLHKHPLYRWDGYSPLTACAFLLDIAESIDQARWAAMQHGSTPDIIFTAVGMDAPEITKFGEAYTQRNGGSRNHRRALTVSTPNPEGKLDVKTPFVAAREMDYTGSWEQASKAVFAVFGIPAALLYGADSFAELYAAKKFYHESTVQPECEEIGDHLTTAVAQPWEEETGELCIEVIPAEPQNEETATISAKDRLDTGAWTLNEVRASQNSPPLPGGDVPLSVWLKQVDAKVNPPEPVPPELAGRDGPPNKGKGPTAGAPPRPENPEGEGTRPPTGPRAKSMSSLVDSAGGALIAPATVGVGRKLGRRKSRRVLARLVKGL
jgi:hypothetical protein